MKLLYLSLFLLAACAASRPEPSTLRREVSPSGAHVGSLHTMSGEVVDLDAALDEHKLVALVFWQTWCRSCLREGPELAAAARAHGQDVLFLGVVPGDDDYVDEAEVRAVSARLGLPYAHVRDRDLALSQRFDVEGTPTIVVLGPGGKVLFEGHEPPPSWDDLLDAR